MHEFVVVGGAGAMGRIAVRDLLETSPPGSKIVVADFNIEAARLWVDDLCGGACGSPTQPDRERGRAAGTPSLKPLRLDVRDETEAARAFKGAAVVINCSDYRLNVEVMKAALKAGANYVDLGGLFHVTLQQLTLDDDFRAAGLTAVIGMGAAPGISNLLASHAAAQLESVQAIHIRVGSIDRTRYDGASPLPVSYSISTILEEFSMEPAVFSGGRMRFVPPMSGAEPHRFPPPVGEQTPMYTIHSEIATLPESFQAKGIQEVSFKIAFDQDFVARVKFLLDMGLGSKQAIPVAGFPVVPVDVVKALVAAHPKPRMLGELNQYEVIRAVVQGAIGSKRMTRIVDCHTAGMPEWGIGLDIDTGSPPSIVAQMLARGLIGDKGVLPPERVVPEELFFKELAKRKMQIKETIKTGWAFST